jgi:GNAT superfamily N-acetyltransferase
MVENPRFIYNLASDSREHWKLELYYTLSPTTNEPVECLVIRNGYGLRMGWSFVRHGFMSEPRVSTILELFVWPTFRRMGIGTLLEQAAFETAQQSGATQVRIILHEADSVVGAPRSAARHFAESRSYSWRWHNGTAPRSTGFAVKPT